MAFQSTATKRVRILSVIGGSVLILLGLAKAAGLFYVLVVASTRPPIFVIKQMVYTVVLMIAGAAMILGGAVRVRSPAMTTALREVPIPSIGPR